MTAFVILDVDVHDPLRYEDYKKMGPPTVTQYGGKYIARGGRVETLEGDWSPSRVVMIQFDSVEQAKAWINSPEYSAARKLRHETSNAQVIVVEGL
jgi:uncharacterized protein (DUF1330 family)